MNYDLFRLIYDNFSLSFKMFNYYLVVDITLVLQKFVQNLILRSLSVSIGGNNIIEKWK